MKTSIKYKYGLAVIFGMLLVFQGIVYGYSIINKEHQESEYSASIIKKEAIGGEEFSINGSRLELEESSHGTSAVNSGISNNEEKVTLEQSVEILSEKAEESQSKRIPILVKIKADTRKEDFAAASNLETNEISVKTNAQRRGREVTVEERLQMRKEYLKDLDSSVRKIKTEQDKFKKNLEKELKRDVSEEEVQTFEFVPYVSMNVTAEELEALQKTEGVEEILEDSISFPTLDSSRGVMGADAAYAQGLTGEGSVVAILDTGVDSSHPALSANVLKNDAACFSATTSWWAKSLCPTNVALCKDSNGNAINNSACGIGAAEPTVPNCIADGANHCTHGTHVAGIAAGNGGGIRGVAPKAKILPVQVFVAYDYDWDDKDEIVAYDSDIVRGLEYVLSMSSKYDITSVNMSLGGGVLATTASCDSSDAAIKNVIDKLREVDIATVIASGNGGSSKGIAAPGCISTAISVGATTDTKNVASYSNESPALSVFAPGSNITSSVPGGGTAAWNGTSMATPHVVGAIALLKQKAKQAGTPISVDNYLSLLQQTGDPVTGQASYVSALLIRVDKALAKIATGATLPVTVVVDDFINGSGVTPLTGSFSKMNTVESYAGQYYQASALGNASVRFTPTIPQAGNYKVSVHYPVISGAPASVTAKVKSTSGTVTKTLNQTNTSVAGKWQSLGEYAFSKGTQGNVELSATTGRLVYDAVKFEYVMGATPAPTAPSAPQNITATAGDGQTVVSFSAPTSNGGSAITGYTVTSTPGNKTATGTASPITVTGLTNGTAYTFTVTATNSAGTSVASSASNSVTPTASNPNPTPTPEAWYNSAWSNRVPLTINKSSVSGSLANFPVYVDLSKLPNDFWNTTKDACADIRITTGNGATELPREIVSCDKNSKTGELHFKADALSSANDTTFYVYYGNAGASDYGATATYGRNNVWNSYSLVMLKGGGTDNSGHYMSIAKKGGIVEGGVSAPTGKGTAFDGVNDFLDVGNSIFRFGTAPFVMSYWVDLPPTSNKKWPYLAASSAYNANGGFYSILPGTGTGWGGKGTVNFAGSTGSANPQLNIKSTTDVRQTGWTHIAVVRDGITTQLYVNGVKESEKVGSAVANYTGNYGVIGNYSPAGREYTKMSLSNFKVQKGSIVSPEWISAEYTNQNNPASFVGVGGVEEK